MENEFLNCHMENGWEVGKIFEVTDKHGDSLVTFLKQ